MLYLLHFDQPYRHARHYLGFTKRESLVDRILEHASGGAACSPLVRAAMRAGCIVSIARVWPTGSRTLERKLKNRGGLARQCPLCKAERAAETKGEPMPTTSETELSEVGRDLANALAAKAVETVHGFPASSARERGAIARFVAAKLIAYAERLGA